MLGNFRAVEPRRRSYYQTKIIMSDTNKYSIGPSKKNSLNGLTGLDWNALVNWIAKHGIFAVDKIRYHNIGQKGGTALIEGDRMLRLWKDVQRKSISLPDVVKSVSQMRIANSICKMH